MYTVVKNIAKIYFKLFHKVSVEGEINIPDSDGYMICCNHIHMFDPGILVFNNDRKIRFMVKEELMHVPIVSFILKKINVLPVKRGEADMECIRNSIALLKNGEVLGVFPEGTRHRDGEFRDIKSGASMIACRAGVKIVPARIVGKYRPFSKITYRIGEPISTDGKNRRQVNEELYNAIQNLK